MKYAVVVMRHDSRVGATVPHGVVVVTVPDGDLAAGLAAADRVAARQTRADEVRKVVPILSEVDETGRVRAVAAADAATPLEGSRR